MGKRRKFAFILVLLIGSTGYAGASPPEAASRPLTFGLFLGSVEEGARVFGPIEFLPFEHPVAAGHEFPNPQRLHQTQVDTLVHLGRQVGLELTATLTRYPDPPTLEWPYAEFLPPPVETIRAAEIQRVFTEAPIPGLRVVAFQDGFPLAFIVDTRGMSLEDRGMPRATSMGLDLTREAFLEGLEQASRVGPPEGAWILVFPPVAGSASRSAREIADLLRVWTEDYHSPQDYIVERFKDHDWIVLGEYHRVLHDVKLVSSLIPVLHRETDVRRLALEFLCRDLTEEANRIVKAEDYDPGRTIDFFRGQFAGWPYREYVEIFEQVWASNRESAAERGAFELVGLHPCIDWEVIHYGTDAVAVAAEKQKQERYDAIMAEALESAVLSKGAKALVFTGIAHATGKFTEYRFGTDEPLVRMGNLVYREPYRSKMFFVALHAPFWDSAREQDIYPFDGVLDRLMLLFGKDVGFDVVGTPFEHLLHAKTGRHSITWYRFGELYDGYVVFRTPIKEYVGVACIEEWIEDEDDFEHFWRNVSNKRASEAHSRTPFDKFKKEFCSPRPDHGVEFRRRFRQLPDLE